MGWLAFIGGRHLRFREKKIRTVGELVNLLKSQATDGSVVWFRGQASKEWSLQPSLARGKRTESAEAALIKRFKQNALTHVSARPADEWEWMFLMQHYRLPTRLLDWTESPLTALYFAIEDQKHKNRDAALWCLDPVALNRNANIKFSSDIEVPAFAHDEVLDSYLPSRILSETTSELNPVAAIAVRNSPRIAAQLGAFTITHRTHLPLEGVGDKKHVWRITVEASEKKSLLEELRHLRITRLTLFPELDSVAADAMEIAK